MASSPETCQYGCGLDLMNGRQFHYADHKAQIIDNRLAFTNKCAIALLLHADKSAALSFPCVKNASEAWHFAQQHSPQLLKVLNEAALEWKKFQTGSGDIWFFNLCGYWRLPDGEVHLA